MLIILSFFAAQYFHPNYGFSLFKFHWFVFSFFQLDFQIPSKEKKTVVFINSQLPFCVYIFFPIPNLSIHANDETKPYTKKKRMK